METNSTNYVHTTLIDFVVIPDVHCRTFWKEVVDKYLLAQDTPMCTTRIVFLGDYLDGYPQEWDDSKYKTEGIDRLEEIINLKKSHPHQIVLLLGNHDCGYAIDPDICSSRMDSKNFSRIQKLFQDNRDCFQLIHREKSLLFSHAGVHAGWLDEANINREHFPEVLNNAWLVNDENVLSQLGMYDSYRGFTMNRYGSPVWADVRSCFDLSGKPLDEQLGYQVFGHTQLQKPIITDNFACLDCRKGFVISAKDERYVDSTTQFFDAITIEEIKPTVAK